MGTVDILSSDSWIWRIARDPDRVHKLLVASDRIMASGGRVPPVRNMSTTKWAVENRLVHILSYGTADAGMITLSWSSPFDISSVGYPQRKKPLYMQRLAVEPGFRSTAPLTGLRVLRHAISFAETRGADALRSETNPSYQRIYRMLCLHGFEPFLKTRDPDGREHIFLQREVTTLSAHVSRMGGILQ